MAKTRHTIPKATREAVLREFNHRCAICGAERPHVHHLDENPSNNEVDNLIPLCPNCHLTDEHDASNRSPEGKLRFFRKYKHRQILKPQFNPLFRRMQFLTTVSEESTAHGLEQQAEELTTFVMALEMGDFYSGALWKLLKPPRGGPAVVIGDAQSEARHAAARVEHSERYRGQIRNVAPKVESLIIELLDYQRW